MAKFTPDVQSRVDALLVDLQQYGDSECLLIVGGSTRVVSGEEGTSTTSRFIGIRRPIDMLMLLAGAVRNFAEVARIVGIEHDTVEVMALSCVDFALNGGATTRRGPALDPGANFEATGDLSDADKAKLDALFRNMGKGPVH